MTFQDMETERSPSPIATCGDQTGSPSPQPSPPGEGDVAASQSVASKPRALNPTRFLCRSEVRDFLLAYARENRTHKFTRVSEETLTTINEQVRTLLIDRVKRLPSMGKTI